MRGSRDVPVLAAGLTATTVLLGLTVAAALVPSCSSSVQNVPCDAWSTAEFFRTVTAERVTACLEQGVDIEQDAGAMTPLHWAAGVGAPPAVIEALLAGGADPNARDGSDSTPLHAATTGSAELVDALLAGGAEPNVRDRFGWSPLHQAVSTGNLTVIKTLLANGADPDASAMWDETPLHMAVSAVHESAAVVGVLLASGADLEALTEDGLTPLHTAALSSADPSTIRLLLTSGANPHARMQAGWTPLHLATRFNERPEIVEALLDGDADPMVRDDYGRLPADLAKENPALNGTNVLKWLESGNEGG